MVDLDSLTQIVQTLFFVFSYISVLLLIGLYLRTKFTVLQKLFLPASVIGGLLGLLLGPNVLKQYAIMPISEVWIEIASLLPGILIVPVVASVPLGIKYKRNKTLNNKNKNVSNVFKNNVLIMLIIFLAVSSLLMIWSLFISHLFKKLFHYKNIYPTFGTEVVAGYSGGHGTTGVVAVLLNRLDQPYWFIAQGVTTTAATVGLLSGIVIGIMMINFFARKNYLKFIHVGTNISPEIEKGLQPDVDQQPYAGKEPSHSSAIDSLSLHLAIILFVSGLSYFVANITEKYNIPIVKFIPEWTYAIFIMFIVWGIMQKLKLDWLIDIKTKTKITTTLTEFAIVAAIISLPVEAVLAYALPLSIMLSGGIVIVILFTSILSKYFFTDHWAERSVVLFGTGTGVLLTGILLLRMVDPEMKSPVLHDLSLSYSIQSLISFIIFPITFIILIQYGYLIGIIFFVFLLLVLIWILRKSL